TRTVEGEAAPAEKACQVFPAVRRRVRHLVGEDAALVDPVAGNVGAEIGAPRDAHRLGRAHVRHLDERARSRVALAEQEEIVGLVPRQDRQVGLDVVLTETRGDSPDLAVSDVLPYLPRMARVDRHTRILPL